MNQVFLAILVGGVAIASFCHRMKIEDNLMFDRVKKGQKTNFYEPLLLVMDFLIVFFLSLTGFGGLQIAATSLEWCLLFLYISIYYSVLLLLLPLLRKLISAWACATLWLIPSLLCFTIGITMYAGNPLFTITVPRQGLFLFLWIWAAGFIGIIFWQLISHLTYRRLLLKGAAAFADDAALSLWHREARRHGVKPQIPVLISNSVNTPVTIGCFDRTMRLILPKQSYTQEEYRLIFRHELRHILRADARTKMFVGFCAAICWFNPLSWIARRKVSEDLELSCDEAVLGCADEKLRRQYAELLLKNAGSARGYTTCLSASANSLRYRLRNIVKPARRCSGSVIVGVAVFALMMAVNTVAIVDRPDTVQSVIFDKAPAALAIQQIDTRKWSEEQYGYRRVFGWNEQPFTEYISSLRVKQVVSGNYPLNPDDRFLSVDYKEIEDGEIASLTEFLIADNLLIANIPYDEHGDLTFLLEDEIDWNYLNSLLDFDAVNPDPSPQPPDMLMYFDADAGTDGKPMYAARTIHSVLRNGEAISVMYLNDSGVGGMSGIRVREARLAFSYPPKGDFTIRIESWDHSDFYTLSSSQLTDNVLPLADYSAHYTVSGTFESHRDTVYVVSFAFDIELPE